MTTVRRVARTGLAIAGSLAGLVLLVPIAIAVLPFFLVARATRALGALLEPRVLSWLQIVAADPQLGWRGRPRLEGLGDGDAPFALTTDEQGLRDRTTTLEESDTVLLGGSLAWGEGVGDEELASRHVGARRVKPLAAPRYSSLQALRLLEAHEASLAGKSVVWLLPIDDDPFESGAVRTGLRAPHLRTLPGTMRWETVARAVGEVVSVHAPEEGRLDRLVATCTPGSYAERSRRAWAHLVAAALETCRRAGARLTVVAVPHPSQLGATGSDELRAAARAPHVLDPALPERTLAETCRRLGVVFASARVALDGDDFTGGEARLSAEGHRRLAALVDETLDRGRSLPSARPLRRLSLVPDGGQAA